MNSKSMHLLLAKLFVKLKKMATQKLSLGFYLIALTSEKLKVLKTCT